MKARGVEGLDPAAPLRANAVRIVQTRLDELRSLAAPALEPGASSAQHDLRIAAKRLRYVLEVTEKCLGAEAKRARKAARALQDVLGEIHDCDVMLARDEEVESLSALLQTRRELLFGRFRELWSSEAERGTWSALKHSP